MIRCVVGYLLFYPTLLWNIVLAMFLSSRRWLDEVDEYVIIGALPFSKHVHLLHELGVRAVVNMCRETAGPAHLYEKNGITCLRLRTSDFCTPNLEHIRQGVSFIQEQARRGHKTYVHCKAGRGRSATIVLCWLMEKYNISAQEAQKILIRCRPHVKPRLFELSVVKLFENSSGCDQSSLRQW